MTQNTRAKPAQCKACGAGITIIQENGKKWTGQRYSAHRCWEFFVLFLTQGVSMTKYTYGRTGGYEVSTQGINDLVL
jgi:Ni/Fe-hydrogenase subunit HybB-like protein